MVRFDFAGWLRRELRATISGVEVRITCPMCARRGITPKPDGSMSINVRKQKVHCWRCQYAGDAERFLADYYQRSRRDIAECISNGEFGHVLGSLTEAEGLLTMEQQVSSLTSGESTIALRPIQFPQDALPLWQQPRLPTTSRQFGGRAHIAVEHALTYLRNRGVSSELIRVHRMHVGMEYPYQGRVLIPSFVGGDMVYYVARKIARDRWELLHKVGDTYLYRDQKTGETVRSKDRLMSEQKIRNPRPSECPNSPGDVLFNYDRAALYETAVVCEGVFDAMRIGPNAMALLGKVLHDGQIDLLLRGGWSRVLVYLDPDAQEKGWEAAKKLARYISTSVVSSTGNDPGSSMRNVIQSNLQQAEAYHGHLSVVRVT